MSDMKLEDVLSSNLDGREKIERIISDSNIQRDFLSKTLIFNKQLEDHIYIPLLYIFLEPPSLQPFDTGDIEAIFANFGSILKIINKERVIYVLMKSMVECWLAVKVLNGTSISISAKTGTNVHILRVQLCFENQSVHHIYPFNHQNYLEEAYTIHHSQAAFQQLQKTFRYISIFEIDVDTYQKEFFVKQRILGLKGSNIVRILYLVEKAFAFQNKDVQQLNELDIKLLVENEKENQLILFGNNWQKFQLAQKFANELFAQIKEEFKFFQDYQLLGLKEARVKRTDIFSQSVEVQYSFENHDS